MPKTKTKSPKLKEITIFHIKINVNDDSDKEIDVISSFKSTIFDE